MRVLLLNRSYYPHVGGIENSLYYLSRELKRQGHTVCVFTQKIAQDGAPREEFADIVTYPRYRLARWKLPFAPHAEYRRVMKDIAALRESLAADLVICRDPMLGLAYRAIFPDARLVYIPAVVIKYYNKGIRPAKTVVGFIKEVLRFCQLSVEARQQKRVMQAAEKVVVFSENVKEQLARGRLCDLEKVAVRRPGVADKFADLAPAMVTEPIFVFVGRLCNEKNLFMLLDAFAAVDCPEKRLLIVGDGDQRAALEKRAADLAIAEQVTFTGATNTPEDYYRQAACFVLPSTYESYGQVMAEAMTCGLPVIGFPTVAGKTLTAVEELVREGETGWICEGFGVQPLADAMEHAVACMKQGELPAVQAACRGYAAEAFSWTALVKECLSEGCL